MRYLLLLLLLPMVLAQPDMRDVFALDRIDEGNFLHCQTYYRDTTLPIAKYYGRTVSVLYDGYLTERSRNVRARGEATIFYGTDCEGNDIDNRNFDLDLDWSDSSSSVRWWHPNVRSLDYEFEIRGLARVTVEKTSRRWSYESKLLRSPYTVYRDAWEAESRSSYSPRRSQQRQVVYSPPVVPTGYVTTPQPYYSPTVRYIRTHPYNYYYTPYQGFLWPHHI